MVSPLQILDTVRAFLERGSTVLLLIACVIFIMWTLIIHRALYMHHGHRRAAGAALARWKKRSDPDSWHSEQIYQGIVSRLVIRLESGIPLIKTLAVVCPLLGLLGTVTGMILIFDVMANLGTTSPRAVAAGVSTATITTMAGMVGALSGIFPAAWLARTARRHAEALRTGHILTSVGSEREPSATECGVRTLAAPVGSALITVSLLFLMEQLILTGEAALTRADRLYLVDFVRVEREREVARKDRKPQRITTPQVAPLTPPLPADLELGENVIAIRAPSSPGIDVRVGGVGSGFGVSDSELMPIYKIAPVYPRAAAQRGLEGWVMVRFTVTAIGSVRDVEVIESSHKIFERSAVAAAAKFKFRPRLIHGERVEVTNVYNKIIFALDQDS